MSTQQRPYTLCTTPAAVTDAVAVLLLSEYLVLDCEGKDIGRTDGLLSIICIGTARAEHIFAFDTLSLTRSEPAMAPLLDLDGESLIYTATRHHTLACSGKSCAL